MKNAFFDSLLLVLRNSGQIGLALSRKMFLAMRKMSWLQILFAAFAIVITIAITITILHVALFLFIVFMLFKIIGGFTFSKGKSSYRKEKQHHRPAGEPYTIDM